MKKFYIEESGYYKLRMEIEAVNEDEALDKLYKSIPNFISLESSDREIEER